MPDYFPDICEIEGSGRQVRAGNMVRIATNGQSRSRSLQSTTYEDPTMMYTNLTQEQVDEIRQFFNDHRDTEFYLRDHIENVILMVSFADQPYSFTPYREGGGNRFRGQVNFVQVAV